MSINVSVGLLSGENSYTGSMLERGGGEIEMSGQRQHLELEEGGFWIHLEAFWIQVLQLRTPPCEMVMY